MSMESDNHDNIQPSETEKYLTSDFIETFQPEIPADATNGSAERTEPDPELELSDDEPSEDHEPESESSKEVASEGVFSFFWGI